MRQVRADATKRKRETACPDRGRSAGCGNGHNAQADIHLSHLANSAQRCVAARGTLAAIRVQTDEKGSGAGAGWRTGA